MPSPESTAAIADREHFAESASMARLLAPRSVAVIGASRESGKIGNAVMQNLVDQGFRGLIYPVNPNTKSVAGVPTFASVLDIPEPVDLAVVIRPAREVLGLVDECARKQVHALVILSSGFAELGEEGALLQRSIVAKARANGMRVVGPNCLGIANTAPSVKLNATFAPTAPVEGNVAFLSQSGGLGIELLSQAAARGIGISQFVSVGNKSDVSGNDLLQYWEDDPRTGVVLLYLESFGNPRKFARIARRISRHKPIVAVKSGRTPAGSRAASSHTAALASSDIAVDALFRQAGVIRVDTLEELLDTAQMLATQPIPGGPRVVIVGNVGGPGILAADACAGAGLKVEELSEATQSSLRSDSPPPSVQNPIDLGAAATAAEFGRALPIVLEDDAVDAVIVVYAPPVVTDAQAVARAIADSVAATATAKPVVACFLGRLDVVAELRGDGAARRTIPAFEFPEAAARALGRAAELAAWRARPQGKVPELADVDVGAASALIASHVERRGGGAWLDEVDTDALLRGFGIPTVDAQRVADLDGAIAAAGQIGYPVALKVGSAEVVHKTDVGGVALHLDSSDAVRRAFEEMRSKLGDAMDGAVVQRMVPTGPRGHRRRDPGPVVRSAAVVRSRRRDRRAAGRSLVAHPSGHRRGCARARAVVASVAAALRLPRLARARCGGPRRPDPARREARAGSAGDHRDGPEPGHRARARRRRRRRQGARRAGTRLRAFRAPTDARLSYCGVGTRQSTRVPLGLELGVSDGAATEHPGPLVQIGHTVPAVAFERGGADAVVVDDQHDVVVGGRRSRAPASRARGAATFASASRNVATRLSVTSSLVSVSTGPSNRTDGSNPERGRRVGDDVEHPAAQPGLDRRAGPRG